MFAMNVLWPQNNNTFLVTYGGSIQQNKREAREICQLLYFYFGRRWALIKYHHPHCLISESEFLVF